VLHAVAGERIDADVQRVLFLSIVDRNRAAMDRFAQMNAGTISPAAFFTPENVEAIMASAAHV
jgi:hypothetical protein